MSELKRIFTTIYEKDVWKGRESKSGKGSDTEQTEHLIPQIVALFNILKIKSMVDCASGDFNWMKNVVKQLPNIKYTGYDIVDDLIIKNREKYSTDKIEFYVKDITSEDLPEVDLVFCRDCLVHLSFSNIKKFLNNFLNSNSKYLLMTSFTGDRVNQDYKEFERMWRTVSFHKEPFNFPQPLEVINEYCTEEDGKFSDKSLILYSRELLQKCGI